MSRSSAAPQRKESTSASQKSAPEGVSGLEAENPGSSQARFSGRVWLGACELGIPLVWPRETKQKESRSFGGPPIHCTQQTVRRVFGGHRVDLRMSAFRQSSDKLRRVGDYSRHTETCERHVDCLACELPCCESCLGPI